MSEKIVQLNEEVIKGQLKELVRGSVEETLNALLEQEAEKLTQAARYERNEARQGYRSGHYSRNLTTTSGDVTLHVPRLKGVSFETAIIERYRRRESSVEEALIEMYLAGVSVRRVEDITEALWGSKVSPATISELNKKAYVHIEDWLMDNVAFSFCHLYPMYGFLLFCHNKRSSYDLDFTIEEPLQLHIYRKSFTLPFYLLSAIAFTSS